MKTLPIIIVLIIVCSFLTGSAQAIYEPQILILSPGDFTFDPSLKKEVDLKTEELKKMMTQAKDALSNQKDLLLFLYRHS